MRQFLDGLIATAALAVLSACGGGDDESHRTDGEPPPAAGSRPARVTLSLVSGSENESLLSRLDAKGKVVKGADGAPVASDLLDAWERQNGARVDVKYMGSVDIMRAIERGKDCEFDAVFPASSMWIALGDERAHVVKDVKSIFRSPVVLAVERGTAAQLGWIADGKAKRIGAADLLAMAEARRLKLGMTSAARSNSGASAFLGFLYAFAGQPDVLTEAHLESAETAAKVKRVLKSQHRSSGSSGWLKQLYVEGVAEGRKPFDAMVNYECLVIEANQELARHGRPPLHVFYLSDALCVADSPLGYVDKGDAAKAAAFRSLQEYLLSDAAQAQVVRQGRRPGRFGATLAGADPAVWNPDWGIDSTGVLSPITIPEAPAIRRALELYMTALRKPSYTVFVLDFSGSMEGPGEAQLDDAMRMVLETDLARQHMLAPGPEDVTVAIPFDANPRVTAEALGEWTVRGNDRARLQALLEKILAQDPGGGTGMYSATMLALRSVADLGERLRDYNVSIVVMSDGESNRGSLAELAAEVQRSSLANDVPVYTLLFGQAKEAQMKDLASAFGGRLFDGRRNLAATFQEVQGYNR